MKIGDIFIDGSTGKEMIVIELIEDGFIAKENTEPGVLV